MLPLLFSLAAPLLYFPRDLIIPLSFSLLGQPDVPLIKTTSSWVSAQFPRITFIAFFFLVCLLRFLLAGSVLALLKGWQGVTKASLKYLTGSSYLARVLYYSKLQNFQVLGGDGYLFACSPGL
uniref:Uncharacterized protein n=1 Tax=Salix viminalis TaxID=40686 RepID=A0A6N2K443_SALVM